MTYGKSLILCLFLRAAAVAADPVVRSPQGAEVVAIGAYIRSHLGGIDECYSHRLDINTGLRGKLMLRFDIEPEGDVDHISADGMNDKPLVECVVGQVKTWHFEKPAAVLRVAYPLAFQPS